MLFIEISWEKLLQAITRLLHYSKNEKPTLNSYYRFKKTFIRYLRLFHTLKFMTSLNLTFL